MQKVRLKSVTIKNFVRFIFFVTFVKKQKHE